MGGHTWTYKAIEKSEYNTAREKAISSLKDSCFYFSNKDDIANYVDNEYSNVMQDIYKTKKLFRQSVIRDNREAHKLIRKLKRNPINIKSIVESCDFLYNFDYKIINGQLYQECGFDIPVRIYGYPTEKFTDPIIFINWIKEKESSGTKISEYYDPLSNKFIHGMSPKMENIIMDFWKKNGDVYIEFG